MKNSLLPVGRPHDPEVSEYQVRIFPKDVISPLQINYLLHYFIYSREMLAAELYVKLKRSTAAFVTTFTQTNLQLRMMAILW